MAFDPTGSFVATKSSTMARRTWARLLSFIADLPTRLALVHTECQFYASSRVISFRLRCFAAFRLPVGGSPGFGLRGPLWWVPVNAFDRYGSDVLSGGSPSSHRPKKSRPVEIGQIGRASCRERGENAVVGGREEEVRKGAGVARMVKVSVAW